MTHTPGPYEVTAGGSPHGDIQWGVCLPNGGDVIAEVTHAYGEGPEQDEANAYLFAAGPDLLDACERAVGFIVHGPDAGDNEGDVEDALRAAIAKAKGESS